MKPKQVAVIDKSGRIVCMVSSRCTSIGAAAKAGFYTVEYAIVNGVHVWREK